jgi:hypothetical protein
MHKTNSVSLTDSILFLTWMNIRTENPRVQVYVFHFMSDGFHPVLQVCCLPASTSQYLQTQVRHGQLSNANTYNISWAPHCDCSNFPSLLQSMA